MHRRKLSLLAYKKHDIQCSFCAYASDAQIPCTADRFQRIHPTNNPVPTAYIRIVERLAMTMLRERERGCW